MITDDTITRWKTGTRSEQIAADMAANILTGKWERYRELPPAEGLAHLYDTSTRTIGRAVRLLRNAGMVRREYNVTYVDYTAPLRVVPAS